MGKKEKGQLYSTETIILFILWMIILATIWNHSNETIKTKEWEWNQTKKTQRLISQSDSIILQKNENPWKGCAVYDESKKRTKPNILNEECLKKLSEKEPNFPIKKIQSITLKGKTTYYEKETEEKNCQALARTILLQKNNEMETAILEIVMCNE